jgi:nicotinamidase-related amidase
VTALGLASLSLDPSRTALVVIDLQCGIVSREVAPHTASEVVARSARLASRFRELSALVVLVRVAYSTDDADRLKPVADMPPLAGSPPPDWADLVPELGIAASDVVVTKRQWGAFYGTELELQLVRRSIRTVVLCGISTNFGVESTARDAYERGYGLVFAEDAMAGLSAEAHTFATTSIFPRIGQVRSTAQILTALSTHVSAAPR